MSDPACLRSWRGARAPASRLLIVLLVALSVAGAVRAGRAEARTWDRAPLRAAFYYGWNPENWRQLDSYPFTTFTPSSGFYDSGDRDVARLPDLGDAVRAYQGRHLLLVGRGKPDEAQDRGGLRKRASLSVCRGRIVGHLTPLLRRPQHPAQGLRQRRVRRQAQLLRHHRLGRPGRERREYPSARVARSPSTGVSSGASGGRTATRAKPSRSSLTASSSSARPPRTPPRATPRDTSDTAATSRSFCNRESAASRRWSPLCSRPMCAVSRRAASTSSSRASGCGSPRARCRGSPGCSTSRCRPSASARRRGAIPICRRREGREAP